MYAISRRLKHSVLESNEELFFDIYDEFFFRLREGSVVTCCDRQGGRNPLAPEPLNGHGMRMGRTAKTSPYTSRQGDSDCIALFLSHSQDGDYRSGRGRRCAPRDPGVVPARHVRGQEEAVRQQGGHAPGAQAPPHLRQRPGPDGPTEQ